MKVAKGYKQTELGTIPEDWHFKTFGEVMKGFSSGQTPSRSVKKFYTGKIPWITSGELNYNVITETIEKITEEAATKTHLKTIPVGTFLMAITGLEAEGTRGSCAITGVEATTNQSCMALYPNEKELTTEYLFQFYKKYGNQLAFKYCQGTKQQSYTGKIAKTLPIVLPPTIEEQTAITNALNETDALITDLEKLITKKQNIKQATMQVLLTGKKRLKGFKGEWEKVTLKQIGECIRGVSYNGDNDLSVFETHETLRLFRSNNIQEGKIEFTNVQYVQDYRVSNKQHMLPNDILICMANGSKELVGKAAIFNATDAKYTFGAFMGCFRIQRNNVDNRFIYYNFCTYNYRSQIDVLLSGSSINNLKPSDIEAIKIVVPSFSEQQAITSILLDIDNEIEALQQQLSKYKLMKEGMMQDLLTGKVRLI